MLKKLRTVIYHVDDLQKAKKWYEMVTGRQPYFDESFYTGFDINGFELGLDPDQTGIREGNKTIAYWAVDDIRSCVDKLIPEGALLVKDVTDVGGGIKVAEVKDPFGNTIGLIEET
ncbi:MAG TPA: VOC family protein [Puia sp.]|jgi:predicted enzyme related to lactoylglutathione lyase|nr:VOC family protein [Puia sp.]